MESRVLFCSTVTYERATSYEPTSYEKHYKLYVTEAMSKAQIRKLVVQYLREEEIQYLREEEMLSESAKIMDTARMTGEELLQLKQLEMQRTRSSVEIEGARI